jgi:hypothetical protein
MLFLATVIAATGSLFWLAGVSAEGGRGPDKRCPWDLAEKGNVIRKSQNRLLGADFIYSRFNGSFAM